MNTLNFEAILATLATVTFVVTVFFMVLAMTLGMSECHMGGEDTIKHALTVVGLPLIIIVIVVILLFVNGKINEFEAFESGFISITIACIIFSYIAYKS